MKVFNLNAIYFTKIREVKSPERAHIHDAGVDFFLPKMTPEFIRDLKDKNPHIKNWAGILCFPPKDFHVSEELRNYYLIITPSLRLNIPSGIKVNIVNKPTALIAFNKSGLSANKGIVVTAQVVDSDYTGEVHVGILNTSDNVYNFYPDDKIGQFLHVPIIFSEWDEINIETYLEDTKYSDRGEGGFGSTDKQ